MVILVAYDCKVFSILCANDCERADAILMQHADISINRKSSVCLPYVCLHICHHCITENEQCTNIFFIILNAGMCQKHINYMFTHSPHISMSELINGNKISIRHWRLYSANTLKLPLTVKLKVSANYVLYIPNEAINLFNNQGFRYIHTYIHTYIYTYIHTYMLTHKITYCRIIVKTISLISFQ